MSDNRQHRDATDAVPYPVRVAAALSWRLLVIAGLLVVLGYVLFALWLVVIPLAVAVLLAALLLPLVNWLDRHGVPRSLATAGVLVGGLALISGMFTFVIQAFVAGFPGLQVQITQSIEHIGTWLEGGPLGLPPVSLDNLGVTVGDWLQGLDAGAITAGAVTTATTVTQGLAGIVLALFLLIFCLYSGRSMWLYVIKLVPQDVRHRVDLAGRQGFSSLGGFFRALVIVAVVDAVGIGIGLWAVGAPLVVPLMALVFLAAFVPIVGAVVSGAVAVLVVLVANGLVPALIVLGVVIGVQQLESNVLHPVLLGRAVQLHPVAVVLAVTAGGVTAGIAGVLLAVPLLAALNAGIRSVLSDQDRERAEAEEAAVDGDEEEDTEVAETEEDPLIREVDGAGDEDEGAGQGRVEETVDQTAPDVETSTAGQRRSGKE